MLGRLRLPNIHRQGKCFPLDPTLTRFQRCDMAGAKTKSIAEINERIKKGQAVVLDAAEMTELVRRVGKTKAAAEVDVVTTGTFSPMCSSGLLFNIGQKSPPAMRTNKVYLNGVFAYSGIAAADSYLGVTELHRDDPLNKV